MWKAAVLVVVAVSLVEGCTYKKSECPDYTVMEQHSDYEVRLYPALTWATTTELSHIRRVGHYVTFMRLSRYISGSNDKGQKMAMTVPVLMQSTVSENATLFQMSFMVPSEFAAEPPQPTNEKVKVEKEKPTLYAVRSFNGYIWRKSRWDEEAQKLADSVKSDKSVDTTKYFTVGYNSPFDFFDRRNEIWMVKNGNRETNEL